MSVSPLLSFCYGVYLCVNATNTNLLYFMLRIFNSIKYVLKLLTFSFLLKIVTRRENWFVRKIGPFSGVGHVYKEFYIFIKWWYVYNCSNIFCNIKRNHHFFRKVYFRKGKYILTLNRIKIDTI